MATIIVLLVATCTAHAQARSGLGDLSKEIQPGQTVMLEHVDGRRITGDLRDIDADGVLLLVDGTVMTIPAPEIRELGVTSDSLRNGALIGLAIGAGLGMVAAATSGSSGDGLLDAATAGPAALIGMAAGARAGVGIGIGLDGLVRRYPILYQAPRQRSTRRRFQASALWLYIRGAARVLLKDASARVDLQRALEAGPREWVRARVHVELAKFELASGARARALSELGRAEHHARRAGEGGALAAARTLRDVSAYQ